MIWEAVICSLAAFSMMGAAGDTEIRCVAPEAAAAGWYNGDTDTAYVVEGLSFRYSREVLWHELAHAWDLKKGTELNGFPSFFSETHTGFDVEEFARLQTLVLGVWPENESFPDEWRYQDRAIDDLRLMSSAGWLMADPDLQ